MTSRDAGRHSCFFAFQAQPVPSASSMFKVNKLAKPQFVARREKEREREQCGLSGRDEGGMQTGRQTELLPSDVPDGPI